MNAGEKVRLKSDPSRIGVLSGETQVRGGKKRLQVHFFDGTDQFVQEQALEVVTQDNTNPYALFRDGRYGPVGDLRGALTFFRLSGKLANLIYSLNTTNTEFLAYQFKPVLNFLEAPSRGILIADEVGLGKTIEAGLIWTELRSRFDARRLLVLCPAILRDKWKTELQNRFGINAELCNARQLLATLQDYRRGELDTFAMIGSLQGLRPPSGWNSEEDVLEGPTAELARLLDESEHEDPLFDLVIVDEAHYLRNPETLTARLGKLVRPVTDAMVLLSATPIQTSNSDLYSLVRLLDEENFAHSFFFDNALRASRPLVQLRDDVLAGHATRESFLERLSEAAAFPALKNNRQIQHHRANPPSDEDLIRHATRSELADLVDRINPLSQVISRTRKRDIQERRVSREPRAIAVPMNPPEASFYHHVTSEVRLYCKKNDIAEGFLVTIPQRQMTSSMAAACRAWRRKRGDFDTDDNFLSEAINSDDDAPSSARKLGPLLSQLMRIAEAVGDYPVLRRNDSKYAFLLRNLREYWAQNPSQKIILFSFYRETLLYLNERLHEDGIDSMCLMGGMEKQRALRTFEDLAGPRLLLASEVASEGIDLQFCSLLINYDLPWNPMKIEQRIGRIDRIGQRKPIIHIWNIFHEATIDERVYERLLQRLNIFKAALGSIENVLGEFIREMTNDLFSHELSVEQEKEVIQQSYMAIANRRLQEERLEEESSHLIAHGDYIQNKVKAAQELKRFITSEDLHSYFRDFYQQEFPGSRILRVDDEAMRFEIELSGAAKRDLGEFLQREKLLGQTRLAQPQGGSPFHFLFDNKASFIRVPNLEVISQFHPVIRYISETYRRRSLRTFHPVVGVEIQSDNSAGVQVGLYLFCIARWSVRVATRDVERLAYQAVSLSNGEFLDSDTSERLINTAAMMGCDWTGASSVVDGIFAEECFGRCEDALEQQYERFVGNLWREGADRVALQLNNLQNHLEREAMKLRDLIQRFRDERKLKAVGLYESKLRKLNQRVSQQIDYVRASGKTPTHESINVANGVIFVK